MEKRGASEAGQLPKGWTKSRTERVAKEHAKQRPQQDRTERNDRYHCQVATYAARRILNSGEISI